MTKEARNLFFFLGFFVCALILNKEILPVAMLSFALLFLKQWKDD